jgi:4-hydroxybenzoate polyprenyltransferase
MTFSQRIKVYSKEQLEPGSRFILSLLVPFFIYLLIKLEKNIAGFNWHFLVPAFSTFFLLLYYRISDEFKDFKTDEKFFPDRPIPSGRLFLSDLKVMLIAVSICGFIINLIFPAALKEFIVVFIFTVAMGKWFFMEKLISNNRIIAFFTHAPIGYLLYWYAEAYLLHVNEADWSQWQKTAVIAFIVLPGLSWEVLRKTYLPQDEMIGYQTYSSMLGFKGSLLFAAAWIVLTILNNYLLIRFFDHLNGLEIPLLVLNLLLLLVIINHYVKPRIKNLKRVVEVYMSLHLLIPFGFIVYQVWMSNV